MIKNKSTTINWRKIFKSIIQNLEVREFWMIKTSTNQTEQIGCVYKNKWNKSRHMKIDFSYILHL